MKFSFKDCKVTINHQTTAKALEDTNPNITIDEDNSILTDELAKAVSTIKALTIATTAKDETIANLTKELSNRDTTIINLNKDLNKGELLSVKADVKTLTENIVNLTEELFIKDESIADLSKEVFNQHATITKLNKDFAKNVSLSIASEVKTLNADIVKYQNDKEAQVILVNDLNAQIAQLKKEIADLNVNIEKEVETIATIAKDDETKETIVTIAPLAPVVKSKTRRTRAVIEDGAIREGILITDRFNGFSFDRFPTGTTHMTSKAVLAVVQPMTIYTVARFVEKFTPSFIMAMSSFSDVDYDKHASLSDTKYDKEFASYLLMYKECLLVEATDGMSDDDLNNYFDDEEVVVSEDKPTAVSNEDEVVSEDKNEDEPTAVSNEDEVVSEDKNEDEPTAVSDDSLDFDFDFDEDDLDFDEDKPAAVSDEDEVVSEDKPAAVSDDKTDLLVKHLIDDFDTVTLPTPDLTSAYKLTLDAKRRATSKGTMNHYVLNIIDDFKDIDIDDKVNYPILCDLYSKVKTNKKIDRISVNAHKDRIIAINKEILSNIAKSTVVNDTPKSTVVNDIDSLLESFEKHLLSNVPKSIKLNVIKPILAKRALDTSNYFQEVIQPLLAFNSRRIHINYLNDNDVIFKSLNDDGIYKAFEHLINTLLDL